MFDFQSDFFKTYELLTEAKDPFYSKNFWAWAKNNKYNELCFKIAFKDDLKELGINLDELFDKYDMFKEKSSYGIIKKALEEHPDSWALKALQKVWVMQFKYDAKSGSKEEAERRARKEEEENAKRAKEQEEAHIKAEADWKILNENFEDIKQLILDTVNECAAKTAEKAKAKLETSVKRIAEIKTLTKNVYPDIYWEKRGGENYLKSLKELNEDNLSEVSIKLTNFNEKSTFAHIWVEVDRFLWKDLSHHTDWVHFMINADEISDKAILKDAIINKLKKAIGDIDYVAAANSVSETDYNETINLINKAKAAQAAADSNKEVDPSFSEDLIDICTGGLSAAEKGAKDWKSAQDGSDGAVYAGYFNGAVRELSLYLVHCNWRAIKQDKEVASWRNTDSTDSLIANLETALRSCGRTGKDFRFEIVK